MSTIATRQQPGPARRVPAVHQQRVRAHGGDAGRVRWFAEHQPFTPVIETIRGLLFGLPVGQSAIWAVAWCVAVAAAGYLWARARYNRLPTR